MTNLYVPVASLRAFLDLDDTPRADLARIEEAIRAIATPVVLAELRRIAQRMSSMGTVSDEALFDRADELENLR